MDGHDRWVWGLLLELELRLSSKYKNAGACYLVLNPIHSVSNPTISVSSYPQQTLIDSSAFTVFHNSKTRQISSFVHINSHDRHYV